MAEQHVDTTRTSVFCSSRMGTAERSEWCAINIDKLAWTLCLRANDRFAAAIRKGAYLFFARPTR